MDRLILYFPPLFTAFVLSLLLTPLVRKIALRFGVVDSPGPLRKIHTRPIPLLGGVAILVGFLIVVYFFIFADNTQLFGTGYIKEKHVIGIILGALCITIGGVLDDIYNLSWKKQIIWPILAIVVVIAFGIGTEVMTNPFGGVIHLNQWHWTLFTWQGIPYKITLLADFFTFVWLFMMMETTKLLDGLDGLVSGITVIATLMLFFVSLGRDLLQYDSALLAIILAGVFAGFLIWNFHPATIFLGESGALLSGFFIGVLAIIAGGKIFVTLLVMGIPLLDMFWVILRRLIKEKRFPLSIGDRNHLHFRLLDSGLSHRQAVLLLYLLSAAFGSTILFIQGAEKIIALMLVLVVLVCIAWVVVLKNKTQ